MIREIHDATQINKVLNTLYKGNIVFLEGEGGGELTVQVIDLTSEGLLVKLPQVTLNSNEVVLSISNKSNLFLSTFQDMGKNSNGHTILKPVKVVIKDPVKDLKKIFTISNVINQADVIKSLSDNRVDQIIKNIPKVSFMFDFFEVFISERSNSRMRLMSAHDKPIFIPNIDDPSADLSGFVPFKEYFTSTKVSDFLGKYKSEICIPIKYKNYIMLGYVHGMHSKRLDSNSFNTFKLVSASIIKDIHTSGLFEESKEICPVLEIDTNTIKFLHPPTRHASRTFSLGANIIFDLIANTGQKKPLKAVVKVIKPTERDFLVTCDFSSMTHSEQSTLEEFLSKYVGPSS